MTDEKRDSINYRFSGYPPPLIALGGSSDVGYWYKFYTHPYYVNQPASWKRASYSFNHSGKVLNGSSGPENSSENGNLYSLLPVCKK
jgi:hypothetical protein